MAEEENGGPAYMDLVRHYEACLAEHGPNHRGVDWPNARDLGVRFDVMLELLTHDRSGRIHLLDLGCGPGLMLDHINAHPGRHPDRAIEYEGIDLSSEMIRAASDRHPEGAFSVRDILLDPLEPLSVDYVVMNGVLTERGAMSFDEMERFAADIIGAAYAAARKGVAFNVMSTLVDWERDDLFHWPFDRMVACLSPLTRHLTMRADYGLREYTVYLRREPLPYG